MVKRYNIKSKEYEVEGVINDYNVVIKLDFIYDDKRIQVALNRPFPFSESQLIELGENTIDSYIKNLINGNSKNRRLMLHYWYIEDESYDSNFIIAHGRVTGHKKLQDSIFINTSAVSEISLDKENQEIIIKTKNSVYYCPFEYCDWKNQEKNKKLVPEYEWIKKKYKDRIECPIIEDDKILLVLSNFDEFYFNNLYFRPKGEKESIKFYADPHIGMFQDSFIIEDINQLIDIRYFPHFQNIEFYSETTNGMPLYVENIGDIVLYVNSFEGLIKLEPGERKKISKENAEKEKIVLPMGDLYPAGIIEK